MDKKDRDSSCKYHENFQKEKRRIIIRRCYPEKPEKAPESHAKVQQSISLIDPIFVAVSKHNYSQQNKGKEIDHLRVGVVIDRMRKMHGSHQ
jgi:hypothetical protein